MKDFVRKLMGLSHDTWLARNLMKHHKTKGRIAIQTKEELLREADKIAQRCSLNIEEKYSWLLDVEAAAYAEMGCAEVQYSIFKLESLHAQEQLVAKRTGGKTTSFAEYCKMCGDGVPVENHVEGDGSLLAEKENEEVAKRTQKKLKPAAEPKAQPGTGETTAPAAGVRPPGKRRKKDAKERTEAWTGNDFLKNEPSPGAAIRDVIGTISSGVMRRGAGKVITKLLSDRWPRGGGKDVVAARECSGGGVETVERQDMVTLQPTKWLNGNIVNFVGKAMIQPRRGRGTAKVHVFNSHLMDKLLGGRTRQPSTISRR